MIWKKPENEDPVASTQPQPQTKSAPSAPSTPSPAPAQRGTVSERKERALIGPTIQIKGDLTGSEDLWIEGRIEGKIDLKQHNAMVGKSGFVKADIYGKTISVLGEVHGNLYAEDQVVLRQASTVRGNLLAPRVMLEDGANFKGSIDMTSGIPQEKKDSSPVPSSGPQKPLIVGTPHVVSKQDKEGEKFK